MLSSVLQENGFSQKEAVAYLCILELGEALVSQIARRSGLKRATVYDTVESLLAKGVISCVTKKGTKYISALSPRVLVDRFKHSAELAEKAIPEFMELAYNSPLKPRIRFYEGIDGIKMAYKELRLSNNKEVVGFTDYAKMPKEIFQFIREEIVPMRKDIGSFVRLIVPNNAMNRNLQKEDHEHFAEHRVVDFKNEKNHIEVLLLKDDTVIFTSFETAELFAVNIRSPAIYQTLLSLFNFIWSASAHT